MKDNTTRNWTLLILLLGFLLSATSAWLLFVSEKAQLSNRLAKDVADRTAAFELEFSSSIEALYTMRALFIDRPMPEYRHFKQLAQQARTRHPDIVDFYWVADIPSEKRPYYEAATQIMLDDPSFIIRDQGKSENLPLPLITASQRSSYRAVLFADTTAAVLPLGLDLAANGNLTALLEHSERQNKMMLSQSITAEIEERNIPLVFLILPLDRLPTSADTQASNGFVIAVLDLARTFEDALTNIRVSGIEMRLWDKTEKDKPILMYTHTSRTRLLIDYNTRIETTLTLENERQWVIEAIPTFYYFENKRSWLPHLVFFMGLAATFLIMRLFVSFAAKNERIRLESRQLMTSNQELEQISRTDALTGVANRRYFDEILDKEWKRALRNHNPLTLVMVDIDCFKLYNDYYGHLEGDECIRMVAQTLKDMMSRPMDLVARYGGEEFAILLPDTNDNAIVLAEQCRKAVEQQQMPHAASKVSPYITISLGMCTINPDQELEMNELIRQADRALYKAKESGRNRVCSASDSPKAIQKEKA
ncbi:diguanylate cyclase (GGDEF) domain-containing protein [Oceanospirillum multiglobuliferum]|uniref:diguanylate cyclase n=1 Tax=Oceanospirillum multiglobuliferum TaxID=64969 RepID=A0A1T4PQE6_9GAMM|nr:diguanylate cyclase [Oceanospirillum multiglobuliferum]OPX55380.1 hypothetical protein BTE48_09445 [Oceanospirillum multiglobuliferum]SJZ93629.1 diguanylate cyclase (GGDEF) domain-containing protein [Oceanospirillum multiglobuliferum]